MQEIADAGAHIVGGCCGTTPAYMKAMIDKLKSIFPTIEIIKTGNVVCQK